LVINQPDEAMALARKNPDLLLLRSGLEETPLHFLVVENHLPAVVRLIAAGASVQAVNFCRSSPLLESVKLGYLEMSRLLLEQGADPIVMNTIGETALSVAALKGDDAHFSLLLPHCSGDINDYFSDVDATGLLAGLDDPLKARCRALGLRSGFDVE
jgi:ankyrin repeat protein